MMDKTEGKKFLASPEGLIFMMGLGLAFLFVMTLILSTVLFPGKAHLIVSAVTGRLVFGRLVGMYFGYAIGLTHNLVIPMNMCIDAIAVLIIYPLFVLSFHQALNIKSLKRFMENLFKKAQANQDVIQKYGMPGLFIFVFFPLWGTGPLVGSVIGFLLNLRAGLNLSIVLGATFLAIWCWALILPGFKIY